jgi:hypothetical protein
MSIQTRLTRLENFKQHGTDAWIVYQVFGKDEYLVSEFGRGDKRTMTLAEVENDLAGALVILPMKCKTMEEWCSIGPPRGGRQ